MTRRLSVLLLTLSALGLSAPLQAQVLQLDFGPTAATGASQTNSPYHVADGAFTDTIWNQVQTADIAAGGLVWSDGTTATGVSINLGATNGVTEANSKTISLTLAPTESVTGTATASTIYAGTSVGTDGITHSTSSNNYRGVGLQVSGLAAGTYNIYIAARNTSSGAQTQNIFVGKGAAPTTTFNYSTYATEQLVYGSSTSANSTWAEDQNYLVFSISITSGEVLNIASGGNDLAADKRGFLNSIQIVTAIPEPSSYAAVAGIGVLTLCLGRRLRVSRSL